MSHKVRVALAAVALGLFACSGAPRVPRGAKVLFDVDFSAPEQKVGAEVATKDLGDSDSFPTRFPSNVFFGHPMVAAAACGLDKQVAVLTGANATQNMTGLQFQLLAQPYAHYHVEMDVCVAQLEPRASGAFEPLFMIFLDVPEAHEIGFTPSGDIVLSDPSVVREGKPPKPLGKYGRNTPVHLAVDFDVMKGTLRIALDGKVAYDGPAPAMLPRSVRAIVEGNSPENLAALDNLLIWVENPLPEPSLGDLGGEGESVAEPNAPLGAPPGTDGMK
jgi:hypothetical protein